MSMNPRLLRPTATVFNPLSIAGLEGWWDAADASTVTIATGVSEWRDKSGNDRHASQGTGNNQPDYTGTLNGRSVITFDGSNDSLATISFSISQPYSLLMVARRTGGAGQNFYDRINTGPALGTFGGVFFILVTSGLNGPAQDTNYHIFHAKHNGASSVFRIDKNDFATGNPGTSALNQGIRFGARADGAGSFMTGSIAEILLFSKMLSTAEQTATEAYLSKKWSVA